MYIFPIHLSNWGWKVNQVDSAVITSTKNDCRKNACTKLYERRYLFAHLITILVLLQ